LRSASLVSVVALSLVAGLAGAQSASNPREALLVTPAWVAQHLRDPNTVIFHVGDPQKFAAKHIAGARLVELSDISVSDHSGMQMPPGMTPPPEPIKGPKNGLILEMPTAEQLRSQLEKLGVSDNSRIIVYSADKWFSPSTRLVFTLDYAGLGNRTVLMDGGLEAWESENHPVTDVVAPPGKRFGSFTRPMVRFGKLYENMMVDLGSTSQKLIERGRRTLMTVTGLDYEPACARLDEAGGHVKTAIVMTLAHVDRAAAESRLTAAGGFVREAIEGRSPR